MEHSVSYVGTYKDAFGVVDIIIHNTFEKLSTKIGAVEFEGSEFDALAIIDKQLHSVQQLERFTLSQTEILGTDNFVEEICNCTFNVIIPQFIINSVIQEEIVVNMNIEYVLGDKRPIHLGGGLEFEKIYLSFQIFDESFKSEGGYFESIFEDIQSQFNGRYALKNCFGCLYSDYSIYGQGALGSMLCFVRQKEAYLKVKDKSEYMEKLTDDYDIVQEIFLCNKFQARRKGTGYRG
ncbi:MAG TPA: DUF6304 family protein [Hymenobacter sp.]|uniref:DUF6304 family protein n=1 Tax=Hymenobacter sp. TaxID=1898978 RepID=UPI002D7E304F|nr:DUF6304 family protein [Hymenobacter sp.]HET9505279.1 DUF6304 family protein [Hymenobacter sp.]